MHLKTEKKNCMHLREIMDGTENSSVLGNQISLNPTNVKTPSERGGSSIKTNLVCEKCLYLLPVKLYIPPESSINVSSGLPMVSKLKSALLQHS